MTRVVAVVLAGGQGRRFGAARNKVLLPLLDHPVIEWSVRAHAEHPAIDDVLLVGHRDDLPELRTLAAPYDVRAVIAGGAQRPDSERVALDHLRPDIAADLIDAVLIHDGARPLVSADLISRVADAATEHGVVPVLDAPPLVRVDGDALVPETGRLGRAQTPQGGPAKQLIEAYDAARAGGFTGTDTVSYLEYVGAQVLAIPGDVANLKITYPADLPEAARLAARWPAAH